MAAKATLRAAFERVAASEVDHVELRAEASAALRRHLAFDVAVWATVDPTTVMWTHCLLDGMPRDERLEAEVFANEYGRDDLLKLSELATAPSPAASLRRAVTERGASERLDAVYAPRGFTDELRVVFVDGQSPWGALCLLRAGGVFTTDDQEAVAALSAPMGLALRRSLLRAAVAEPASLDAPPGLVLVGEGGRVDEVSDEAAALLAPLSPAQVPAAVHAVVARRGSGQQARASLALPDGRWLAFHATRLGGRDAVVVEQVRSYHLAELIVRAHGLTMREREVVEHVAQGRSTRRIAGALGISEWTVQDHLKAIFAKFGVASRSELVAKVFFEHYAPRHEVGATPSPYGWYLGRDGGG